MPASALCGRSTSPPLRLPHPEGPAPGSEDKSAAAAEAITEEMNLAMMEYMPLRGALSFGGGAITREQIEGLLKELNRS